MTGVGPYGSAEKLVILSQTKSGAKLLLYGTRLKDAQIIQPKLEHRKLSDRPEDEDTLRVVEITADQAEEFKNIVLQKKGERPILLAVPSLDAKTAKKPEVKAKERVTVGADEAILLADQADQIKPVKLGESAITFEVAKDKKTVTLKGLATRGTVSAAAKDLVVEYPDSVKVSVTLDVVSSKIETVAKP